MSMQNTEFGDYSSQTIILSIIGPRSFTNRGQVGISVKTKPQLTGISARQYEE